MPGDTSGWLPVSHPLSGPANRLPNQPTGRPRSMVVDVSCRHDAGGMRSPRRARFCSVGNAVWILRRRPLLHEFPQIPGGTVIAAKQRQNAVFGSTCGRFCTSGQAEHLDSRLKRYLVTSRGSMVCVSPSLVRPHLGRTLVQTRGGFRFGGRSGRRVRFWGRTGSLSHLERIARTRWPRNGAEQLDGQHATRGRRLSRRRQIHPQMIRPFGGIGSKPAAILTSCGKLSKELRRSSCCHFQGQTCDCQEQKRCCQTKQSPVDGMVTIVNLSPCELLRMGGVSEDDTATISGSRVDGDPSVTPFPSWPRRGTGPGRARPASRRFPLRPPRGGSGNAGTPRATGSGTPTSGRASRFVMPHRPKPPETWWPCGTTCTPGYFLASSQIFSHSLIPPHHSGSDCTKLTIPRSRNGLTFQRVYQCSPAASVIPVSPFSRV